MHCLCNIHVAWKEIIKNFKVALITTHGSRYVLLSDIGWCYFSSNYSSLFISYNYENVAFVNKKYFL